MAKGKICRVDGCDYILRATHGQVCPKHRARFYKYGNYHYISPNYTILKKGLPCPFKGGYMRININGKRVLHHRYIMEKHIGRKLKQKEVVHHINGNPSDNRIENLELLKSHADHISHHHGRPRIVNWSFYNIPQKNVKGVCIISACERKTRARCLCHKHYLSFYRNVLKRQH